MTKQVDAYRITAFSLALVLFVLGCKNQGTTVENDKESGSLKSEISASLNLNEDYEVILAKSIDREKTQPDIYINNTRRDRLFHGSTFCNVDSDCKGWGVPLMCFNANMEKYDDDLIQQRDMLEGRGFKQDTQCTCYQNECLFNGEPYRWIKDNLPPKSVVMMWWDYGKNIEMLGLTPVVKNPSESSMDAVAACNYDRASLPCLSAQKEMETDAKIRDVSGFFTTTDINRSICIANKYGAAFVFVDESMVGKYPAIAHINEALNGKKDQRVDKDWVELKEPAGLTEEQPVLSKLLFFEGNGTNFELTYSYTGKEGIKYSLFKVNYPDNINAIC